MRKAQASFEYLMVIGIALLILVALVSFSYKWARASQEETSMAIAQSSLNRITEAANLVYAQGPPAKTRILVEVPNRVESISIFENIISMRMRVGNNVTDVLSTARANMSGMLNMSSGYFYVTLESVGDKVNVTQG